ncbi:winged helix-turn-helix domain-containing protein [Aurantimonas coralicida]|uniref:winged helix-turn-helix domain-containing protein n=1 Tax=Aurantimonas coralicida TaxID=182270 RepID=UPI0039B6FA73|nr:winged helix-turn-helix domain-containing protein [Aurantimonas coralicida]
MSTWTLAELSRWIEAWFEKRVHPASLSRILRRNGFLRQEVRSTTLRAIRRARRALNKCSPRP